MKFLECLSELKRLLDLKGFDTQSIKIEVTLPKDDYYNAVYIIEDFVCEMNKYSLTPLKLIKSESGGGYSSKIFKLFGINIIIKNEIKL